MNKYSHKIAAASIFVGALTFTPLFCHLPQVSVAYAEIKPYIGVGKYIISDFEDYEIAKQRAKYRAEQDAKDKAGVYLRNYSSTSNARLTENDILTITNNIVNEISIDYQKKPFEAYDNNGKSYGEVGIMCVATIKVNIDTDGIANYLKFDSQTKLSLINQTKEVQKSAEENDKKVELLRERAVNAKTVAEREQIKAEYKQADKEFLANEKCKQGIRLFYKASYNVAINKFNESIQLNPTFYLSYKGRGLAYSRLHQHDKALADFNKTIELNPNDDNAYYNRGITYYELENFNQALTDFTRAITINPKYSDSYTNRGITYTVLKEYDKAFTDFNKAIELNPNDSSAYNGLGNVYRRLFNNLLKAIEYYTKAIEVDPNLDVAYINRALVYGRDLNNYETAIEDLTKAIEINPNNYDYYFNRAGCYSLLNQYEKAIADYDKALELAPNNSKIYYWRGKCYEQLGNTAKAQADYAKAKQLE